MHLSDNGMAYGGATPTGDPNTTHLKDRSLWAAVLLNAKRPTSAAIGALRRGAGSAAPS